MLKIMSIPGLGDAVAGLDWLQLTGVDRQSTEMRQLAASADAKWRFEWKSQNASRQPVVAFIARDEISSKRRPVAAAALVRAAIPDTDTFLSLINLGENYWVCALKDGQPVMRMDFVGDASSVMSHVRDFVSTIHQPDALPVYTDLAELLDTLPYTPDIRPFSVEILAHSVTPKDYTRSRFDRHFPVSISTFAVLAVGACTAIGYWFYQNEIDAANLRNAAKGNAAAAAQRHIMLEKSISSILNANLSAAIAVPTYLRALHDLPLLISGWKLHQVSCQGMTCTLTYKAHPMATWRGYMLAKPDTWETPVFNSDLETVVQPLTVQFPPQSALHKATDLKRKDSARFMVGNLAQVSYPLKLHLTLQNSWSRIAGQGMPPQEIQHVPERATFTVTGPAMLLESFSERLPSFAVITSIAFNLAEKEKINFELKGDVYARP